MGGIERSDYDEDEDYEGVKNKTVGPLSWKQGDDDDDESVNDTSTDDESGNDTIEFGKDSETASLERSYTSLEGKGGQVEQSRNCH
jgi:hypothetical protein